jgi:gas vesicle protein
VLINIKSIGMKNSSKILIALGAGVALGAIVGVLFAPNKGAETRKKIAEAPEKIADKIRSKIRIGKEKFDEKLEKVNDVAEELA